MTLSLPPLDVAAATSSPATTIADGVGFAHSLVAAAGLADEQPSNEASDDAAAEAAPGADVEDATLAALATATAASTAESVVLSGDRLLAERGTVGRSRAVAAAAVALARIDDLEPPAAGSVAAGIGVAISGLTTTVDTPVMTAPALPEGGSIAAPADNVVAPAGSVAAPAESDATPVESVAAPAEPSVGPADQLAAPADPLAAPADPLAAPADPLAAPADAMAAADDAAASVQPAPSTPTTVEPTVDRGSELTRSVAARVEAAVEALRNAPPPREATIEVEGMRLLLRLRGDIVQVSADTPLPASWQRDLGAALEERGLQLGQPNSGGTSGDADDRRSDERAASADAAVAHRTTQTTSASRPAGRDDSVLL